MKLTLCRSMGTLLSLALATFVSAKAQTVTVIQTNGDQSLLMAAQPSQTFGTSATGSYTITVNPNTQYQQMDGFGGAMTDSSAYLIYNKLTASQQATLMQNLFSTSTGPGINGIGLNFLRQPMGASDFTAQGNFTYDDVAAGSTDPNLTNFSIAKDLTYTIPVLKQALAVNPNIKFELLPWSPPAWMKNSPQTLDGGTFNDANYPYLAQYFVKTIQAYQGQGIPVYAIAPQNEPDNNAAGLPSEGFTSSEEATFIGSYLGPQLANASLSPKIFAYDHNWNDTSYPLTVLGNSAAYAYTAGVAWHCYQAPNATAQTTVESQYPAKGVWFDECSGETSGSFSGDMQFAMDQLIIGSVRNYAKSVLAWNIALDQNSQPVNSADTGGCTNCRGFVTINTSTSPATVTYNVENYIYGHAAKFVVPGAYRIDSTSGGIGSGAIEDVAFENPNGSIALIVYNDSSSATNSFNVTWAPTNTSFTYSLPPLSVATFTWTPANTTTTNPPTNLKATAASSTQINLTWTASTTSGATYSVYRSTTSGFTPGSGNLVKSGVTTTSYSDTGLSSGTTYYYEVEAVASGASSNPSNSASATTTVVAPTAPSNLVATAATSDQINLTWSASATNGVTYSLYRSTTSGFTAGSGTLIASGLSATSYANTGLTASTTYYYLVQAVNSAGSSPSSNAANATTPASGVTLSTTSYYQIVNQASSSCLDDTGGSTSNGTVLQQYTCYSNNLNQEWKFTSTTNGYYEVTTYNSSTVGWDVTGSAKTAGTGVQLYTYGAGLNEQFLPVKASGYYELVDRNSGLCLNLPNTNNSQQVQIATCTGATSQLFALNVIASSAPAAPTAPSATAASSSSINLSWTASTTSGVTYSVYGSTTSGFTPGSSNLITSGLTTTTYSNTGLAASTTYYYVVEAVNSAGNSPASTQVSATTSAAASGGISTTSYYTVVNQASGSCVDDTGGSTSNGTVLQQYACGSGNYNQQWKFTVTTGSYYEVTSRNSSTLGWDVVNAGTAAGTGMQLWTYSSNLNQQFQAVLLSSGYYEFIDRNSGLCLNVPNGTTTNGQQLQINTCNGATSEAFKLTAQ